MFNTSRSELASAVTMTVGTFKMRGYEYRPATLSPGDAWPLVATIERGPGDAFLVEWTVVVVLGSDEETAARQLEEVLPSVVAAIEDQDRGYVSGAAPAVVQTGGGDLFAMQINVRSD